MIKLRIIFFILLMGSLLAMPIVANAEQASITVYCSTTKSSVGDGTEENPYPCMNEQQFHAIVAQLCSVPGIHYIYQLFPDEYVLWEISTDPACAETVIERGSYVPPTTGSNLPAPMIATLAVGAGLALVGGGLFLRKKNTSSI
jgi:hypothetical protein